MDLSDENIQMLMAMGFPSESEVKRALKMAKNDMNEAVDILTNGQALSSFDDQLSPGSAGHAHNQSGNMDTDESQEFPAGNLYELEQRVFTDSWSIPYREDESLAKCMIASIKLLSEGRAGQDELCSRFLDKCLPESFRKLLRTGAVKRWSADIQEGVYDMLLILMEVVATALSLPANGEQAYIPHFLLDTLSMAFDADCEYHQKNKTMRTKIEYLDEKMVKDNVIRSPIKGSKEYYWLLNLVNKFAYHGGFKMIAAIILQPKTSVWALCSLTSPLASCAKFLEPSVVKPLLEGSMKSVLLTIENLGPDDFRDKHIGKACDVLRNIKVISMSLWSNHIKEADDRMLDLVLRMMRSPHFNAKMNALIEITKMIEDATNSQVPVRGAIALVDLTNWMRANSLLSIILSGSIDQAQYCEKVKKIVEHVGPHLSKEDLEKLWNRTNDQSNNIIDNIHGIFAAAASQFSPEQFTTFTTLITTNWAKENEPMKEKLLTLLGHIGRDTKNVELSQKVLEVFWELSHQDSMSRPLIDKILDEMYVVMTDSYNIKDSYKKKYVTRCIEDIQNGQWIMPAVKQLHSVVSHLVKVAMSNADKTKIVSEIQKITDITKLLIGSLVSCHQRAVEYAISNAVPLHSDLVVDEKYTHKEYVEQHLNCLKFLLEESNLVSLSWSRSKELWECMVCSPVACAWDRDTCFIWFTERINELDTEATCNLFTKKLMVSHSVPLTKSGFECWKKFFEHVNIHHKKLKGPGTPTVEKMDLIGLEELWGLCLNVKDTTIAQWAINLLLQNIYTNLAQKFKKDIASLHRKFIDDCHGRLEALLIALRAGCSVIYRCLSQALSNLTAVAVPGVVQVTAPLRPTYLLNIQRLLLIVEQYILAVEEVYSSSRSVLPHGASFYGSPLTIHCECEARKEQFDILTHRNESLLSLRGTVAERLGVNIDQVHFVTSELKNNKDQRLLGQLGIEDGHKLYIRLNNYSLQGSSSLSQLPTAATVSSEGGAAASVSATAVLGAASPSKPGNWELEKNLPGVMMAHGGQVFRLLYQLADLAEPRITQRVAALLQLIPTDPAVLEIIENLGSEPESLPGSRVVTPCASPTPSPRKATGSLYGSQSSVASRSCYASGKLAGLFSVTANSDASPFRVRYNLEVLSSCIMPVDLPAGRPSRFCEEFLSNNGLSLIMKIFQVDFFPADVDYEVRQACYSLGLQIMTFLLCGETVRSTQSIHAVAANALLSMDRAELSDMIVCLMRVAWAAGAGKLQLSGSMQPTKDANVYGRLRQNSAESNTSSNSDTEATCLYAGVCLGHTTVGPIDVGIAVKALELMVFCLQMRPDYIGSFYSLPCVADFIIDILTGCCREDIRTSAAKSFQHLAQISPSSDSTEHPKLFILAVVLSARLPYWVSNASTRGARQRLLSQCFQYFDLRSRLLKGLTILEQKHLNIDVVLMLNDEIAWLCNFQPFGKREADVSTDDVLLTGHLRLVRCLLTCEGVNKLKHSMLINTLLEDFLFPATKLEKFVDSRDSLADFSPKCMVALSQTAAYKVLLEMCRDNLSCLQSVCTKLTDWHHSCVETGDWEFMPPVDGRASSGYVGLKNGGATCYMNSVLQQLFMVPDVADSILGVDDADIDEQRSVFHEVQQVFGHLMDSQLQYYTPEHLWNVFKLWGQTVNVREQQDAFDFFTSITDQLDESLKRYGREPLFQKRFQGVFSDQKNCEECPHKYEREEPFLALNLQVSNPSLQESLSQFVKGELLEGDNAYFCEKCNQKRNAIKRMCIKSLPPVLCIHLKRFSFDWEANKALKFDDYFKFPLVLDMGPYTMDGKPARYELVGAVVHTGQASAGHYYSFIRERRGNAMTNENHGKWFKFNDTTVEEFAMTEEAMESECYGGRYKAKVTTDIVGPHLPEDRVRYWNAYLLIYERISEAKNSDRRMSGRVKLLRKSVTTSRHESLSELTDLVHQGEKQGTFASKMPGRVQQSVRINNLQFMKNRNVYSNEYFRFLLHLVSLGRCGDESDLLCVSTASKFILNTYLRTKETLRADMDAWLKWFSSAFAANSQTAAWFMKFICDDPHTFIIPYLLVCPIKDIRQFFYSLLKYAVFANVSALLGTSQSLAALDPLLETLLALLNREVVEHARNAYEYFSLFFDYSSMLAETVDSLMANDVLVLFINFLVGKIPENSTLEDLPRKFTSLQTREYGPLHTTIAMLILHLDLQPASGAPLVDHRFPRLRHGPEPIIQVTDDVAQLFSSSCCPFYIREALHALKDADSSLYIVIDGLVYLSNIIPEFSDALIKQVRQHFSSTPGNELRAITKLAAQIILLPDNQQESRLEQLIGDKTDGALLLIRSSHTTDSQRSYQLIKLLVDAAEQSDVVANYLLSCATEWQWCVDWLKKRMGEQNWMLQSTASNEGSLSKNFQRTMSAQVTLNKATAMLTNSQGSSSDMDVDSINSEELQTVPSLDNVTG